MKREQLERIARAMHALLDASEVGSISAAKTEYGRRVCFYPETDEDVQAMCGAFRMVAERLVNSLDGRWWLSGSGEVDGIRINIIGPTHEPARELVDAKVDFAVAQAVAALGGDS